jgi:hypothetical protein
VDSRPNRRCSRRRSSGTLSVRQLNMLLCNDSMAMVTRRSPPGSSLLDAHHNDFCRSHPLAHRLQRSGNGRSTPSCLHTVNLCHSSERYAPGGTDPPPSCERMRHAIRRLPMVLNRRFRSVNNSRRSDPRTPAWCRGHEWHAPTRAGSCWRDGPGCRSIGLPPNRRCSWRRSYGTR